MKQYLPLFSLPMALTVWHRNLIVYGKTWKYNILPNFFEPIFYLVAMGMGIGGYISEMDGVSYITFIAPGLLAISAANGATFETTYNAFVKLHFDHLYDGVITTQVNAEDIAAGEILWGTSRSLIYGMAFWLVLVAFQIMSPLSALLIIPLVILTGMLFSVIGLTFTAFINSIDLYSYYYTLFLTPLFLLSNIFFPIADMPVWLQKVAWFTPLVHVVNPMRGIALGNFSPELWLDLLWIAAVILILGWIAIVRFRYRLYH